MLTHEDGLFREMAAKLRDAKMTSTEACERAAHDSAVSYQRMVDDLKDAYCKTNSRRLWEPIKIAQGVLDRIPKVAPHQDTFRSNGIGLAMWGITALAVPDPIATSQRDLAVGRAIGQHRREGMRIGMFTPGHDRL